MQPLTSPFPAPPPARPVMAFALRMLAYYVIMAGLYRMIPNPILQHTVYPTLFGHPTASVIDWLWPDEAIEAMANQLSSPRAALEIVRGCDGSGVLFLMTAAVLAFPAGARARLAGVVLGMALVYGLNLLRLGGLYFIAAYQKSWFVPLHTYFIPSLMIVVVALFYLHWLTYTAPDVRD